MGEFKFAISMSLDGFVAGPNQTVENPLGEGGEQLHEWAYGLEAFRRPHGMEGGEVDASSAVLEEAGDAGAAIMGRGMFGGGSGPWGADPWEGWWGDEPPFRYPVFVLTHHPRDPLVKGETTFTFVTDGIESALARAREAAGARHVRLGGGANVAQQYLAAGLLDEVLISVVPILLHGGTRLFEDLGGARVALEQVETIPAPGVTHVRYRVRRGEDGDAGERSD
ncbi:MAG TPA: dihydrofolate reductase family protein [Actinomycetota bacterium]|nr:dihydrofolate reductase family protein [Actinomycetota bacterium]